MELLAQPLPRFDESAPRYRYGARSEAAIFVGDLLCEEVPALGSPGSGLEHQEERLASPTGGGRRQREELAARASEVGGWPEHEETPVHPSGGGLLEHEERPAHPSGVGGWLEHEDRLANRSVGGWLEHDELPADSSGGGWLEIVAIARRPGVLSKVAVRPRAQVGAPLVIGIGADHLARVSRQLDGERIEIIRWQRNAAAYIAAALGLGEVPPVLLLPTIGHARVLLGEIDVRGIAGWRGLNTVLASALTGWRIRLEPVASTEAWRHLGAAFVARRPLRAAVIGRTDRGPRIELNGLFGVLSGSSRAYEVGEELEVRVTRMDPDEGRIFASDRLVNNGQLPLI
jgi:transcription antitermination factor NusA-like protein